MSKDILFDIWYDSLCRYASSEKGCGDDKEVWRKDYENGKTVKRAWDDALINYSNYESSNENMH